MKKCPFCASDNLKADSWVVGEGHYPEHREWAVVCQNCGAFGPNDLGQSGAEEMWNLRRWSQPQAAQNPTVQLLVIALRAYQDFDFGGSFNSIFYRGWKTLEWRWLRRKARLAIAAVKQEGQ